MELGVIQVSQMEPLVSSASGVRVESAPLYACLQGRFILTYGQGWVPSFLNVANFLRVVASKRQNQLFQESERQSQLSMVL